jgi:MHS family proline/betaine transporter-like MFS transporter
VTALVVLNVTDEALLQWAWRVPFLLGSVIAVMGWYLRARIPESPAFEQARQAKALSSSPIRDVLTYQRRGILQVIGLVWVHGVAFYLLYVYLTTYMVMVTTVSRGAILVMNTISMTLLAILIPIMGRLSDRVGQKPLLVTGTAGLALTSYPLFAWLAAGDLPFMLAAQTLLTVFVACYMGPFFATVVELFPTAQRYTGLSLGYNLSSALFGGTAPLIATLLIEWTGNNLAPSLYLSLCAVISLGVVLTLPKESQPAPTVHELYRK